MLRWAAKGSMQLCIHQFIFVFLKGSPVTPSMCCRPMTQGGTFRSLQPDGEHQSMSAVECVVMEASGGVGC